LALCLNHPSRDLKAPPPLNYDGSFDGHTGHGARAVVIRDHGGSILAAHANWYGPVHEALVAEAMAARDGLLLAR
jgi:hypothetical protein